MCEQRAIEDTFALFQGSAPTGGGTHYIDQLNSWNKVKYYYTFCITVKYTSRSDFGDIVCIQKKCISY